MDFHYMNSGRIITNVKHGTERGSAVDDFFIVRVNHWEAAQFLGRLYVDEDSMMRLLEWAIDYAGDYALLISTDGRFGAVVPGIEVDKPKTGSKIVNLYDDFRAPISRVKSEFRKVLERDPKVASELNLRAFQKAVPDRLKDLGVRMDFTPETIGAEVSDAIHSVESATDDALVWIALVAATQNHRLDEKAVEKAARELQMRLDKKSEFRSTFFPLDQVTNQEITARARRAKRDLENCEKKFPAGEYFTDDTMFAFARRLSNDRLADLCVLMHYQENWGHPPFKVLLIDFGQRVWKALGRD